MASHKRITVRSSDGKEFQVSESAAVLSVTIRNMILENGGANRVISLKYVDGKTLAEVIGYLNKHAADSRTTDEEKKNFDEEFVSGKSFGDLVDFFSAAHFLNLDIEGLSEIVTEKLLQ